MPSLLYGQAEARRLRWAHREVRAPLRQAEGQAVDPAQRAALFGAKLAALIRAHSPGTATTASFPGGAALVDRDGAGWVLAGSDAERALGGALAWANQSGVPRVHVLADPPAAGVLARRSTQFDPAPSVWEITGTAIAPAVPAEVARVVEPDAAAMDLAAAIARAGADVVVEHGVVIGEVLGLEVARVVGDDEAGGEPRVEVGVGRHDREAFALMHRHLRPDVALEQVVETVRRHRRADGPSHPLRRLAPERWLRRRVIESPDFVGASELRVVDAPVAPAGLREMQPAAAAGHDGDGHPVVAVCSVGIDVDLVPFAADVRLLHAPDARLVLVVPERDVHPVTTALAAALVNPAAIVAVTGDWRAQLAA